MKKTEFDDIIKQNLIKRYGEDKFGYCLSKNYENYYSKNEFETFLTEMKEKFPSAFSQYDFGKGSELKEQKGRYGFYPPKMASVASSSRFCYISLRNGGKAIGADETAQFEVGLTIRDIDGIPPQLDACFLKKNIFVEAKCHEIFDNHKVVLKEKYWEQVYGADNEFGFPTQHKTREKEFEIPLNKFGIKKSNSMFDIKQLLCHLMGIASQKAPEASATLLYLFFMPKTDDIETSEKIKIVFDELKNEIENIFSSEPIKCFTEKNKISLTVAAEYAEVMEELTNKNIIYLSE